MKNKNSLLFFLCFALIIQSCRSFSKIDKNEPNKNKFDQVLIGQTQAEVKNIAGEASEISTEKKSIEWFYNNSDETQFQKATISFEVEKKTVKGILIIPSSADQEVKIDFLKKQKFQGVQDFIEAPLKQCKRDYIPSKVFYVSAQKGVIIEFDRRSESVQSYSRTSPEYAKELIEKIKSCKR